MTRIIAMKSRLLMFVEILLLFSFLSVVNSGVVAKSTGEEGDLGPQSTQAIGKKMS